MNDNIDQIEQQYIDTFDSDFILDSTDEDVKFYIKGSDEVKSIYMRLDEIDHEIAKTYLHLCNKEKIVSKNLINSLVYPAFDQEVGHVTDRIIRNLFDEIKLVERKKTIIKETQLERIENNIEELLKTVATKDDLLAQTNEIISSQESLIVELNSKLEILRAMQESNLIYKKLLRYSSVGLLFFGSSFFIGTLFDTIIVTEFWNNLGIGISFGFFIMSLALRRDWKNSPNKNK